MEKEVIQDIAGESFTFAKDAWRRFSKNKLALFGVFILISLILLALFGQYLSQFSYSDQNVDFKSIPPIFEIRELGNGSYFYLDATMGAFEVTAKGELIRKYKQVTTDLMGKIKTFHLDDVDVIFDYSSKPYTIKNTAGEEIPVFKKVWNKTYPFGTDDIGRDLFIRVVHGARISLLIGLVSAISNIVVGVSYGAIAGFVGGRTDIIMMRIQEILSSIPRLLYVIILMLVFGSGVTTVAIVIGLTGWMGMARMVRGQILSLRESEYVLAARTSGANTRRIIVKHLLPNASGIIIIQVASRIPNSIFTEASLSFVGLGVSAPQASWGTLANNALPSLMTYPYKLFFPSMAISLTVLAFNFIGDGLRDALDPRLRD